MPGLRRPAASVLNLVATAHLPVARPCLVPAPSRPTWQDRRVTDITARRPLAVVTGASSGIGAATARRLAVEGFHVVAAARRAERIEALAADLRRDGHAARAVPCDVTSPESVTALAAAVRALDGPLTVLVNNAGGARGLDPVERGDVAQWQWMYDVNVLGTLRMTQALLPDLEASGAGTVVMVSSIAGHLVYEGGAGYTAAKHAQTAMTQTLRLELNGRPVRVIEIDPGMVHTEEFSLTRFDGDAERAASVYAGVTPLTADDVADCIAWTVTRPHHVNVDRLDIRPLAQAAPHKVHRS
jgi:NADP-dependent 3-hydroxy acid dehydrogenase YdfG